jgi:ribosomal protein L27
MRIDALIHHHERAGKPTKRDGDKGKQNQKDRELKRLGIKRLGIKRLGIKKTGARPVF